MKKTFWFLLLFFVFISSVSFLVLADTVTLRPDGSGDSCNIPFESGDACPDHYKNVDEETVSYADYVKCDAVNSWVTDLYEFENMSAGFSVDNVTVFAVFKGDNGGLGQGKITLKSGGSFNNSSYVQPGDIYRTLSYKMENNPITSTNWTWSDVNNLQIGISLKGNPGGGPLFPSYAYCYHLYAVVNYSGTRLNCYNENNASNISCWNVEISNSDGSEVYFAECVNNTHNISISDMPSGSNTIFTFSADGYETRSYVLDVSDVVNLDAYLPPEQDQELHYTSQSVSDSSSDVYVLLECDPDRIVQVEGYNESLYGHWFTIPDDKWSLSDNNVTVDASVLDENTSVVRVTYYCDDDVLDYVIHVIDEVNDPVDDAKIEVKRLIDDSYVNILSVLTDGNGDATCYLIPDQHYKIVISKTNYVNETADWTPSENIRTKTFQLSLEETEIEDEYSYSEEITFTASMNSTGVINIIYVDALENTTTANITVYENNSDTAVYWYNTTNDSFNVNTSALNTSLSYQVYLDLVHDTFGDVTDYVFIPGVDLEYRNKTNASEFDDLFEIFGPNPFGWHNFIGFFVLIATVFTFGKRNTGLALMLTGGVFLFLQYIIGITLMGSTLGIVFILIGGMIQWRNARSEVRT